jgi:4-amino-4-deoxy-L-arabinose transferase-like glycosyltransferase
MHESSEYQADRGQRFGLPAALSSVSMRDLPRYGLAALGIVGICLAIVVFGGVWSLPSLLTPLSTDEAYYALGGRTVLQGDHLYTDFWDIKPPLVYLIYVIPLALIGDDTVSLRAFLLITSVLATGSVFLMTRRYFGTRAGLIAAFVYGFAYVALADFLALGEAESFMVIPLALAFATYRTRDDEAGNQVAALAAGALLGAVVALKFSAFLLVLGLPLAELLLREKESWSLLGAVKRLALATLGFTLVQALWVGYLMNDGVWHEFIDIQNGYTIPYNEFRWAYQEPYLRALLRATGEWIAAAALITAPAWMGLAIGRFRGRPQALNLFAILIILTIAGVWWQGKLFHYHWLVLMPLLAPLAGYAGDSVLTLARSYGRGALYQAAALLLAGFVLLGFAELLHRYDEYDILIQHLDGRSSEAEAQARYGEHNQLVNDLVTRIRTDATPEDTYLVWGLWTLPYLEVDRPFPSRFIANHGLRAVWAPEEWRLEFMSEMATAPPRFIVVARGDNMPWLTGADEASDQYICHLFPAFRDFIGTEYEVTMDSGLFILYDRDAPEHEVPSHCALPP